MKYQVTFNPRTKSKVVKVDTVVAETKGNMSNLNDVDSSNKNNNYVLVWDQFSQKHIYVDPSEILDRADNVNDDSLDYGTY